MRRNSTSLSLSFSRSLSTSLFLLPLSHPARETEQRHHQHARATVLQIALLLTGGQARRTEERRWRRKRKKRWIKNKRNHVSPGRTVLFVRHCGYLAARPGMRGRLRRRMGERGEEERALTQPAARRGGGGGKEERQPGACTARHHRCSCLEQKHVTPSRKNSFIQSLFSQHENIYS